MPEPVSKPKKPWVGKVILGFVISIEERDKCFNESEAKSRACEKFDLDGEWTMTREAIPDA